MYQCNYRQSCLSVQRHSLDTVTAIWLTVVYWQKVCSLCQCRSDNLGMCRPLPWMPSGYNSKTSAGYISYKALYWDTVVDTGVLWKYKLATLSVSCSHELEPFSLSQYYILQSLSDFPTKAITIIKTITRRGQCHSVRMCHSTDVHQVLPPPNCDQKNFVMSNTLDKMAAHATTSIIQYAYSE